MKELEKQAPEIEKKNLKIKITLERIQKWISTMDNILREIPGKEEEKN